MGVSEVNQDKQHIQLLIALKLQQLHGRGLEGIAFEDLQKMLYTHVWKHNQPTRLNDIANDVLGMHEDDVVRWLATQSRIEGFKASLDDFAAFLDEEEL